LVLEKKIKFRFQFYGKKKKTSLFISLCILRDLLEQKILSELCSGGDPAIFLRSHVSYGKIL